MCICCMFVNSRWILGCSVLLDVTCFAWWVCAYGLLGSRLLRVGSRSFREECLRYSADSANSGHAVHDMPLLQLNRIWVKAGIRGLMGASSGAWRNTLYAGAF